jgi:4-amino-4-deoxy-L-arabinose transferase-like glycosyltransferase
MSAAGSDQADRRRPQLAGLARGLEQAAARFLTRKAEGAVVAWALAAFFLLWTLYHTVSNAAVDTDADTSEVSLWAQNFAFGHKHPPLTAWLFRSWFALFPRTDWAVHLVAVTVVTAALAITWRLLRDHLDRNRALLGLTALTLVPLYTFLAPTLDANSVLMPFWPAALLFYLRARRGLGVVDAFLAGAFAGLAFLGKYWTVYLIAGMAAASLVGAGTKRFWRSPAPYLMALGAALVVAPHLYWFVTQRGGETDGFLSGVMNADSFAASLARSGNYLLGAAAYVCVPLLILASLRPSKAALAELCWPADPMRRQALVLLAVPLLLPALTNLIVPQRLTALWTFPNWPLLPIVLFSSPLLAVETQAVARAGLTALAVAVGAVVASPVRAYVKLVTQAQANEPYRAHYAGVAKATERLAGHPVETFWGSPAITMGLPYYMPKAHLLRAEPLSAMGRAERGTDELVIICLTEDARCQAQGAALAHAENPLTLTRTYFGFFGPPATFQIVVVPAKS